MVRGDVEPATTLIANEANGYPYFLQEYGRAAWDVAPGPTITHSDVLIAITDGRRATTPTGRQPRTTSAPPGPVTATNPVPGGGTFEMFAPHGSTSPAQ